MTNLPARVSRFSADALRAIDPRNVAAALIDAKITTVDATEILGSGFRVIENKDKLLGIPFLIIDWHYSDGDHGTFVSVLALTEDDKIVFNDGSSGIMAQIQALESEGYGDAAIRVLGGLRKSEFWYDPADPQGEKFRTQIKPEYKRGTTYYLSV